MKVYNLRLQSFTMLLACVMLTGLMQSCKKSTEAETPKEAPVVAQVSNSIGADSTKGNADSGTDVRIDFETTSKSNLTSITTSKIVGGTETTLHGYPVTTGFTGPTKHSWTLKYTLAETTGEVTLKVSVTNADGLSTSKSFVVTVNAVPTVNLLTASTGSDLTFGRIGTGNPINFTLKMEAEKGIDSIKVTWKRKHSDETNISGYPKTTGFTTANSHNLSISLPITRDIGGDTIVFTFSCTDKVGKRRFRTFRLATLGTNPWLTFPGASSGLFLQRPTGVVSKSFQATKGDFYYDELDYQDITSDINEKPQRIDLCYFYTTTGKHTLSGPSDFDPSVFNGLLAWPVRNKTIFHQPIAKLAIDHFTWQDIEDSYNNSLPSTDGTGGAATRKINLQVGQSIPFMTQDGRKGIIDFDGFTDPTAIDPFSGVGASMMVQQ